MAKERKPSKWFNTRTHHIIYHTYTETGRSYSAALSANLCHATSRNTWANRIWHVDLYLCWQAAHHPNVQPSVIYGLQKRLLCLRAVRTPTFYIVCPWNDSATRLRILLYLLPFTSPALSEKMKKIFLFSFASIASETHCMHFIKIFILLFIINSQRSSALCALNCKALRARIHMTYMPTYTCQ